MSRSSPIASHLEFLVEEPSMEAFLEGFLPRILEGRAEFRIHSFRGKTDLLAKLSSRLKGYAEWLPLDWRIIIVLDCDQDDCRALKARLETIAKEAGLATRSVAPRNWRVVNRIAIEELEAWFFGDWEAVRRVYARVPADRSRKEAFRDPDRIKGGTWEALERELQRYGHFRGGLQKINLARSLGCELGVGDDNRSSSFHKFRRAVLDAVLD